MAYLAALFLRIQKLVYNFISLNLIVVKDTSKHSHWMRMTSVLFKVNKTDLASVKKNVLILIFAKVLFFNELVYYCR